MDQSPIVRRLAAILAADVAGYSRLMSADEEATLRTLNGYRRTMSDLIAEHAGRIFGTAGDSVIAEFSSPVQAVRAAVAFATKNLGNSVEITIRDNGGGIPPEVREKMFNPLFTTKPPGEGTGLGLSLSYDIVVKQHTGLIEVDTRPGEYAEFKVILPRMAAASKAGIDT